MTNSDTLPHKPLLAPWRDYATTPDRFILRHGEGMVVFEGRASTTLLPELAKRLDGTRTISDIVEELGNAAKPAIEQALTQLHQHGLLLETDSTPAQDDGRHRTARSLSEISVGALPLSDLLEILRRSHVVVIGAGQIALEIHRLLRESGVNCPEPLREMDARQYLEDLQYDTDHTKLVVAPTYRYSRVLSNINSWALKNNVWWTQVLPYDGANAVVGPTFIPNETGCYHCFKLRQRSTLNYFEEAVEFDAAAEAENVNRTGAWHSPAQDAAVAGQATQLIVGSLLPPDQSVNPLLGRCFTMSWGVSGPSIRSHTLHRVPRCRECGRARNTGIPQPWFGGTPMRSTEGAD